MAEPVTLQEAKQFMRIDPDYDFDDAIINLLISSNREYLEGVLGISLVQKTGLKYKYNRGCRCGVAPNIYLPYGPVSNVVAKDADNNEVEVYNLTSDDEYPAYRFIKNINITYDAGNWENGIPFQLKQALLMLVATSYENRENFVIGSTVNEVTQNAMQLAWGYNRNIM